MIRDRTDRCDHCNFYRKFNHIEGHCQYFPPKDAEHPIVASDGYCSWFEKRGQKA